jgi:phosphate transport system protein
MGDKHISTQFDVELNAISTRLMEMGGMVEAQLQQGIEAFVSLDATIADGVLSDEKLINQLELEIDHDISSVIGRRQPTARDLRLLIAMSRMTSNLERAGDEIARICRMVKLLADRPELNRVPRIELRTAAEMASMLLHKSLDAFARLDEHMALTILKEDDLIDREYEGFVRKLLTYVLEDTRAITGAIDMLFVAKAVERIGDHAKNLAESTIYVVKGQDVRHASLDRVESLVKP